MYQSEPEQSTFCKFVQFSLYLIIVLTLISPITLADDEEKLAQVKQELRELSNDLNKFRDEQDRQLQARRNQALEISKLHRQIFNSNREIQRTESRIEDLSSEISDLERTKSLQYQALKIELRAMYISGNEEPLKLLLNQGNPEKLSRMLTYYRYLLRSRSSKIDEFQQLIDEIFIKQEKLGEKKLELLELNSSLENTHIELKASLARQDRLIQKIQSKIETAEQRIAIRRRNAEELEHLIAEAIRRIARLAPQEDQRPIQQLRGELPWPVSGKIIKSFGSRDRPGTPKHQGVTLRTKAGSEVKTLHSGRVVFADYMRGYGLLVIVDHSQNYMTLYGHNQSLFVEPGDWVKPQEPIALVGENAELEEPGLYLEIRHKGIPINPASWCR